MAASKPTRKARISGVGIGVVVAAVAIVSQLSGRYPAYESPAEAATHGASYAASLLILVVPASIAAFCGRWMGRAALATRA